ncbi:MAG: hypothetical protein P1V36_12815 [Planctomycetota bacterium]|nr:hypothetical protein [Planctomycetota bacterium]
MAADGPAPARRREPRAERPRKKKGKTIALILLLFLGAPAAGAAWYFMQPAERQQQIQDKLPEGWQDRAVKAGICIGVLFVLAKIVLPLLHGAAGGLGRALAAMRTKPTWLRVVLFPIELILWILFTVARLGRAADAVAIVGLCALFLILVVRIMKPELLAEYLPAIVK